MFKRSLVVSLIMVLMLACIHVVVNVYFPESEAKGALASLEDELLKGSPAKPQQPAEEPAPPSQSPSSDLGPAKTSGVLARWVSPQAVYAAGPVSEEAIYNKIKSMPQVVEALSRTATTSAHSTRRTLTGPSSSRDWPRRLCWRKGSP
jgi:hypothetical protein